MAPLPRDRDKLSRMEQAVRVLIHGLGEDLDREGLRDTPKRVAKALLDCTQGYHQDTASTLGTALFHEPIVHQGGEGVVVVRDIDFASTSEETLLPFHGRCHVAYRPKDGVVLGLSKLARLTKQYAKRLQTQERLAAAIALALQQSLECHGVAVVLQARHLSNSCSPQQRTNACVSGVFAAKDSAELEELLALLDLEDLPPVAIIDLDSSPPAYILGAAASAKGAGAASSAASTADPGVPAPGTPDPSEKDTDGDSDDLILEAPCCCEEMEGAVQQLLAELGEDPHRPGLAGAARRYVMALLASTSGYHMQPPTPLAAVTQMQTPQQLQGRQAEQLQQMSASAVPSDAAAACERREEGSTRGGGVGREGVEASDSCSRPQCCANGAAGNGVVVAAGRGAGGHHHHHQSHAQAHMSNSGCLGGGASVPPACVSTPSCNGLAGVRTAGSAPVSVAPGCCSHAAACCRSQPPLSSRVVGAEVPAAAAAPVAAGSGPLRGAVTLRMPFASQCEHHMLPFYGNLMVSYLPGAAAATAATGGAAAVPVAAVEAAVLMYTQRLQVQERITHQVADAVEAMLRTNGATAAIGVDAESAACDGTAAARPAAGAGCKADGTGLESGLEEAGVMVVCDAAHMCMVARGVENHSGSTTTFAVRGAFATRPELRRAVLRLFREQ